MTRWLLHANLRLSYASELGAATAYAGHARHVHIASHRAHVEQVRLDELHHRAELLKLLERRGLRPWVALDWLFWCIGSMVAFGCRFWGDWASATGASWFEINGVAEYRRLGALARRLGEPELVAQFERMAAQEQAHRDLFHEMSRGVKAALPVASEPGR